MPWLILVVAGFLEVVWAAGLKLSHEQVRPLTMVVAVVALVLSVTLLATAMKNIPLATAYVMWTGIGAVGTFLLGVFWFAEPVTVVKIASLLCVIVGLVGLKGS